jgi:nitrate/nitrite transporter NarK
MTRFDKKQAQAEGNYPLTESAMSTLRRWLIMACLSLSGGIIYLLPFLREVYYLPLQKALGISNTQLGVLMSVFGATALLTYFPGGWLADRVSPRKLITFSMLATGLSGFYFATFPSYPLSIVIHGFWGITCSLTFWGAMIKATRNWAPRTEQGRAFGILEGGRGIAELATSTTFLAVFAKLGSGNLALSRVIILFSITDILIALLAWFILLDTTREKEEAKDAPPKIGPRQVLAVLKMPVVWLISVVIMAAYGAYWGSYYFTPYATDAFLMSVVFGGAISVGKMWLKPLSALGAGFLADKAGTSRTVAWCLSILIASFGLFVFTPGSPKLVLVLIVNTAVASLAIFALRGIYFALLEEGGVPLAVTGTAAGIVSVVGFTPDVFMPIVGGVLLDRYPGGLGYRYFFALIVGLCILGLLSSLVIHKRRSQRREAYTQMPGALDKDRREVI